MNRRRTGTLGEEIAAESLIKRGYCIIEKNYRTREGEVDIIATKDDCLVFIEVRTKRSGLFGTPEESITEKKKEHLRAVANRYRDSHQNLPPNWRIDVVCIDLDQSGNTRRLEIIENAVEDEY
jgi:putative endonuclease